MKNEENRYLLFGGSFDPVHNGHIALINFILEKKIFDQIFVVPVANAPHKKKFLFNYEQRFSFLQKIFSSTKYSQPNFSKTQNSHTEIFLSDIENHLPAPQYTYRTLQKLEQEYSGKWSVLMGQDSFSHFASWKNATFIAKKYSIYVAARGDFDNSFPALEFLEPPIFLENNLWNISSSQIKEQLLYLQVLRKEVHKDKNFDSIQAQTEATLEKNIPPEIFTEVISKT